MKYAKNMKVAAVMDTFFVTFLLFLAGCLFCIFTLSTDGLISLPLMVACGMILGFAGGAYNYFFWMQYGRGAFSRFV